MRHRSTRIILLVVCLLLCGVVAAWFVGQDDPAPADETAVTPAEGADPIGEYSGEGFDPLAGTGSDGDSTPAETAPAETIPRRKAAGRKSRSASRTCRSR